MKFDRDPYRELMRAIPWGPTPRRLSAARRALKRQRDKLPLFAAEISAGQPTPEERIRHYDELNLKRIKDDRNRVARQWIRGRMMLRKMSRLNQDAFLNYWNRIWFGPRTALYFLDLLDHWNPANQSLDWTIKPRVQSA